MSTGWDRIWFVPVLIPSFFSSESVLCSIRFLYLHIAIPSSGYHFTGICISLRYRDVGEM